MKCRYKKPAYWQRPTGQTGLCITCIHEFNRECSKTYVAEINARLNDAGRVVEYECNYYHEM